MGWSCVSVVFLLHDKLLIVGVIGVVFLRVKRRSVGSLSVVVLWSVGGVTFALDGGGELHGDMCLDIRVGSGMVHEEGEWDWVLGVERVWA